MARYCFIVVMNKVFSLFLLLLLCTKLAVAQTTIGLPAVQNFKSTDYKAATQIYDVKQDKEGILYFANNDGLLTFDGSYWKIYPMPNHTSVKSLAIDAKGRIYVGGQDEVGYFYPNQYGVLKFHSIKQLLPVKARQFADVWDIVIDGDQVFFRTIEAVFQYEQNHITVFDAIDGWRFLTKVNQTIVAYDNDMGLLVFDRNHWVPKFGKMPLAGMRVTGITNFSGDTLLVSTQKNGLYLLHDQILTKRNTPIDGLLATDLLNCIQKIDSNRYVLGTAANGVLIVDGKGYLIQKFANAEGLQNSNVYHILSDHDKNLWLALGNGVSLVNYNNIYKKHLSC